MNQSTKAALCAAALLTVFVLHADAAQTVSHLVRFDPADIAVSRIDGFDLIEIRDDHCALEGPPGEPFLPVRNVHILLPPGTRAVAAQAIVIEEIPLEGGFRIYPAQPDVPVSEAGPYAFVEPDAQVYASQTALPQPVATLVDTVLVRGYHVAVLQVRPLS